MIILIDDGTLDTVVCCTVCGEEMRYTYDGFEPDGLAYDDFITWAVQTEEEDHKCVQIGE